ncbi:MAG: TIGR03086 family metal-binding protein [Acidimicrobiia bacterium]|nr:TIGR03086 family metal-binding protein [Acidimicrobiia bacterium]
MSENLRNFQKAIFTLDAVVRRTPADAWDNPSGCADWTAREVLGHVIWGITNLANRANGLDSPPQQPEADIAGNDPEATWIAARDLVLGALDRPGVLQTVAPTPFGEMAVDDFLGFYPVDPLLHSWDIAKASGVDPALPTELCELGYSGLQAMGDNLRFPGGLGPVIDIGDDADIEARVLAISGRDPR